MTLTFLPKYLLTLFCTRCPHAHIFNLIITINILIIRFQPFFHVPPLALLMVYACTNKPVTRSSMHRFWLSFYLVFNAAMQGKVWFYIDCIFSHLYCCLSHGQCVSECEVECVKFNQSNWICKLKIIHGTCGWQGTQMVLISESAMLFSPKYVFTQGLCLGGEAQTNELYKGGQDRVYHKQLQSRGHRMYTGSQYKDRVYKNANIETCIYFY